MIVRLPHRNTRSSSTSRKARESPSWTGFLKPWWGASGFTCLDSAAKIGVEFGEPTRVLVVSGFKELVGALLANDRGGA